MTRTAIKVDGLWKEYTVGATRQQPGTFYDLLSRSLKAPRRRLTSLGVQAEDPEKFWALRDVNFEVQLGEVVGVIGRNGAGKSTLLKMLSRITAPTKGRIEVRGRLASLLEVGTGFHPELSGRENIFLNGAILGMSRNEVARKFDEIVAFAEVQKFIDTPVKRYSSGMYVRLAFAVAANLEADILIVDEVLAVGDAQFQQRCLRKMEEVSTGGRTILLVSHNLAAISRLCTRALLLDHGELAAFGSVSAVTAQYHASDTGLASERVWRDRLNAPGDTTAHLCAVRVRSLGNLSDVIDIREDVEVEVEYEVLKPGMDIFAGLTLLSEGGIPAVFTANWTDEQGQRAGSPRGRIQARCKIPGNFLSEGFFKITVELSTRTPTYHIHGIEHDCVAFNVIDNGQPGSVRGRWGGNFPGVVRPALKWTTELL